MTEVLFYHLERQPLEAVLPVLLQKTLERGWKAVVQAGTEERIEALCNALWTWRDDAFIPHGTQKDGSAELQPIWLTGRDDTPNDATVRFYVDGAALGEVDGLERAIYMFDGRDNDAVAAARDEWRRIAKTDHAATYWQQSSEGRWQKKA
jgi:DNA polymerase-3 subunit chi